MRPAQIKIHMNRLKNFFGKNCFSLFQFHDLFFVSAEKTSFLARIFRRSGRKRGLSAPPSIQTFSAQFPPTEWFNPKVIHMHCVGTQTKPQEPQPTAPGGDFEPAASCRSYSVPRRSKSPHPLAKHEKSLSTPSPRQTPSPRHTPSPRRLQPELPDRTSRSRRSSVSKSSKSLNETRIYEEIRHQSSATLNDEVYTKLQERKELPSTPATPKYPRRLEKRSASLPRRKTSPRPLPVTHTDFPYDDKFKDEVPITPNVTSRRSTSFENIAPFSVPEPKLEDKCVHEPHDMTSLTSSGYDTQTNSIISTNEVPYSLKISNNYLTSSTPPSSLTIVEDPAPFLTSNVSVTGGGSKSSLSVEVTTPDTEMNTRVNVDTSRQKLERFPSLYSPREVLKTGFGFEQIHFTPAHSQDDLDKLCDMFPKIEVQKPNSKIPIKKVLKRPLSVDNGVLISTTVSKDVHFQDFPSLSDLTVNFKSLAAQNILNSVNNVSVTSVDTLVEVNMAANVSKDFGVV